MMGCTLSEQRNPVVNSLSQTCTDTTKQMSKRGRFRIQVLRASMTPCESFLVWVGDMGLEPGSCFNLACLYIFGKSVMMRALHHSTTLHSAYVYKILRA